MKAINKEIARLTFEIILAIIIIIVTHMMWGNLNINKFRAIASNSYKNTIAIKESFNLANNIMIPLSYNQALQAEKGELLIENLANKTQEYNLLIVISKNSTLDFNLVNILINNIEYKLKDQNRLEDEEYFYILLNKDTIKDNVTYEVKLYLDENVKVLEESKTLNYYFEIKEYSSLFANN